MRAFTALAVLALAAPAVVLGQAWSYEDPDAWGLGYPACGHKAKTEGESPIDLSEDIVTGDLADPITFNEAYFQAQHNVKVTNNGHSLQLDLPRSGGYLLGIEHDEMLGKIPFYLQQIHFHWGKTNTEGSEHTVWGSHYPLEMHLVHWNSNFDSFSQAAGHPRGLAVVGVFFQVGAHNAAFDPILEKIAPGVVLYGQSFAIINDLLISSLLPTNQDFYHYSGSLTTPPCYESVNWFVLMTPLYISEVQLNRFRALIETAQNVTPEIEITPNFRPVQPANGRPVHVHSKLNHNQRVKAHEKAVRQAAKAAKKGN